VALFTDFRGLRTVHARATSGTMNRVRRTAGQAETAARVHAVGKVIGAVFCVFGVLGVIDGITLLVRGG
jgi:hypothetical protein